MDLDEEFGTDWYVRAHDDNQHVYAFVCLFALYVYNAFIRACIYIDKRLVSFDFVEKPSDDAGLRHCETNKLHIS